MTLPDVNPRAFARAVLRGMGFKNTERYLLTEAEVAVARKRSESARKGWATRKSRTFTPPKL